MDLGQSTVLGLAIVADAAGVDEAEYHKVSAVCVRARTRVCASTMRRCPATLTTPHRCS